MQATEKHKLSLKILGHHILYFDLHDIQITGWNVKNSVNAEVVYNCVMPNIYFDILDWIDWIDNLCWHQVYTLILPQIQSHIYKHTCMYAH